MQQQASLRSCENYRSYITAFYNWVDQEEMIHTNHASKLKPIKFEKCCTITVYCRRIGCDS